jgi:dienelactone hydrolase
MNLTATTLFEQPCVVRSRIISSRAIQNIDTHEMLLMLSVTSLILANAAAGYLLPHPHGKYNVTLTTGPLVDYSRNARALMVSIFQPTKCAFTVPVHNMPTRTAKYQGKWIQKNFNLSIDLSPLFIEALLPVCPNDGHPPLDDVPILLFSPGLGGTRLWYNIVASAIASEGFTVVTMDHPGDTNMIEFPDGHAIYSNVSSNITLEDMPPYLYPRAADVSFIIDQLSNATAMSELLPQRGTQPFPNAHRVAMLGHSFGGATSVYAAGQDSRICGVVNLDGTNFGSLPSEGLYQPVLYVASNRSTDASWDAAWSQQKGPKLWVRIAELFHTGFLDIGIMLKAAGKDPLSLADLLGTTVPDEVVSIVTAFTSEWMMGAFRGKVGGLLLEGQEPDRFPEVSIVRRNNF